MLWDIARIRFFLGVIFFTDSTIGIPIGCEFGPYTILAPGKWTRKDPPSLELIVVYTNNMHLYALICLYICIYNISPKNLWTLLSRGLTLFFAGFWDLQTTSFEIPWFLGSWIYLSFGWCLCVYIRRLPAQNSPEKQLSLQVLWRDFDLPMPLRRSFGYNIRSLVGCYEKPDAYCNGHLFPYHL